MTSWALGVPQALAVHERPVLGREACEAIVAAAEAADRWAAAGVYQGSDAGTRSANVDPATRSVSSVPVSALEGVDVLGPLVAALVAANDADHRFDLWSLPAHDAPSILRYEAGGADHFRPHRDVGPFAATRKLTFSLQLSDPAAYQGCDLAFADLGSVASREQGTMITFPASQHHHVTPIVAGTRYVLVGWVHGPTFR